MKLKKIAAKVRRLAVSFGDDDDDDVSVKTVVRRSIRISAPKVPEKRTIRIRAKAHNAYIEQKEIYDNELYAVSVYVKPTKHSGGYTKIKVMEGYRLKFGDPRDQGLILHTRTVGKLDLNARKEMVTQNKCFVLLDDDSTKGFDVQLVDPRKWRGTANSINRRLGWENV